MIDGFAIGQHTADQAGWLTGTTVVLARAGAVGGVDVRGGGPGTRETDLLNPTALVASVHAVVLSGGSAYGLAAADGVMAGLEAAGIGLPMGPDPSQVVPIVPAAVIFDLGRGGDFRHRPDASFGRRALDAATEDDPATGCVGAGTGATCGGLKGGFGWAQTRLGSGVSVAAAVVVNATGSAVDPVTGRLWADRYGHYPAPTEPERVALQQARDAGPPSLATTIGVLLTDARLTKARAAKVAAVGHDGMARAIAPLHSMLDGDTVFCLASGRRALVPELAERSSGIDLGDLKAFDELLAGAADVFTAGCLNAILSARTAGPWPGYTELAPSTVPRA